ncbi:MAG: sensor domain-containing diguanylate cyclase [Hyphomicrobiales bacterium]|nr:MAG: sensor domain-containing diguanylate cyclase [Hyphomicrobiales bacterium]
MLQVDWAIETQRLDELARFDILDTPEEEPFERVARLASRILDVPMATVAFLDGHRQWFKARLGVEACETARGPALCNVTIRQSEPLIVTDALRDGRFADNPFVTGPPYVRFYAGIPLRSGGGQNIGTLCVMAPEARSITAKEIAILQDLAAVIMDALELRQLASVDGLTSALSRRAFREAAAKQLALAKRHGHEASCLLLDLDHFKAINDSHGHAVGDTVLAQTVASCRSVLRETDLIGRIGGEEFAVLLPHTSRQAAIGVAEKLRSAISAQSFPGADRPFSVTASCGIATFNLGPADLDTMLQRADEALYAAKEQGRDRCVAAATEQPESGLGRRVLKAGQIVFHAGRSAIDCTVKRLSEQGASIAVLSTAGVPDRFKLAIAADGFSKTCEITRKAGGELEVRFT